ncbi:Megakaryocyte-associated tyrosine-protein kinase [Chionoecetes opilio]|uniref:Megakaryocyte-associated tyrosine-protein kinase n=1 Tax=Chionoecetes opilio TaxID=41210 RepID=A0A8J4XQE2_CHIOP|nr:Megakaryocyte-associated tyrosine-protein kinase [Chionoecetes opilio]
MAKLRAKIFWMLFTWSVAMAGTWIAVKLRSPAAHEKAVRMRALLRQAEAVFSSSEVKLYNKLTGPRWLGRLGLQAASSPSEGCTAPSTGLRFLPVVGDALLEVRFQHYNVLHDPSDGNVQADTDCCACVPCGRSDGGVAAAVVASPAPGPQELRGLTRGDFIAEGAFGSVRRVVYRGQEAVIKELKDDRAVLPLLSEARVLVEVDGAGGAPRLLAASLPPPPPPPREGDGVRGQVSIYHDYVWRCSVQDFLASLISIARRLGEIHAMGIVHNDIKSNNITISGTVAKPAFHIIDFGVACRVGQICWNLRFVESVWVAPEVTRGRSVAPSADVYSVGKMVE